MDEAAERDIERGDERREEDEEGESSLNQFGPGTSSEGDDDVEEEDEEDEEEEELPEDEGDDDRELWQRPPYTFHTARRLARRELGRSLKSSPKAMNKAFIGSRRTVEKLTLEGKLEGHDGCVNCAGWNEAGTLLVSGSDDLDIRLWDPWRRGCLATIPSGHTLNVFQAKFLPQSGDCHVVSCARDGQVRIAQLAGDGNLRDSRLLVRHARSAHKLTLPPHEPHSVLSAGEDGAVFHIDLRAPDPQLLLTVKDAEDGEMVPLYSIQAHPRHPHLFLTTGREEVVRIYDRRHLRDHSPPQRRIVAEDIPEMRRERGEQFDITCAVFNHDGSEILASYNDEDAYLFHSESGVQLQQYRGHRNAQTVKGCSFWGADSEAVLSGSDCGHLFVWDRASGGLLATLSADYSGVVNVLEPHPWTATLATAGLDHDVKLWSPLLNEAPSVASSRLRRLVCANEARRKRVREAGGRDVFHMILHRLVRQANRERNRNQGSDDSDDDGDSDADEGDSDSPQRQLRCRQQ